MVTIYSRRNRVKEALKQKETLEKKCPHCGSVAKAISSQEDRITYKCESENCGAVNIYTLSPADIKTKSAQKKKRQKYKTFMVRDKSKDRPKSKSKKPGKDAMEGPPKSPDGEKPDEPEREDDVSQRIATIRESMQKGQTLTFEYVSAKGVRSNRIVEPYKIEKDKKGEIVLWAWCQDGNGIRRFKLGGVFDVSATGYPYKPKFDVEDKLK